MISHDCFYLHYLGYWWGWISSLHYILTFELISGSSLIFLSRNRKLMAICNFKEEPMVLGLKYKDFRVGFSTVNCPTWVISLKSHDLFISHEIWGLQCSDDVTTSQWKQLQNTYLSDPSGVERTAASQHRTSLTFRICATLIRPAFFIINMTFSYITSLLTFQAVTQWTPVPPVSHFSWENASIICSQMCAGPCTVTVFMLCSTLIFIVNENIMCLLQDKVTCVT